MCVGRVSGRGGVAGGWRSRRAYCLLCTKVVSACPACGFFEEVFSLKNHTPDTRSLLWVRPCGMNL